ncbi:unnamed protein product [Trichobilharzia szidati]|nr:unnamed protein product [Trichobilharzia szidati]
MKKMFSLSLQTNLVSAKPLASTNSKHLGKSKTPEIASVELVLLVREWNETAITRNSEESLKILDKYCQDVKDVVKSMEKKLSSVALSCDIPLQLNRNTQKLEITVQLMMSSSEVEKAFSSKAWFRLFKESVKPGAIPVDDDKWPTAIVSVTRKVWRNTEYTLSYPVTFEELPNGWCQKVEKQVSKLYPGLKETIEKCSFNKEKQSIQLKLSSQKLLQKGYLSSRNVLFWRFLFGVTEVQLADVNSEVLIAEIELSVKPLVIGDNKSDRRFLAILDNLCKDVKEVVKRTEPRLSSIPLSCDIPQLDPNQLNTPSNITVLLAMPHSEMQQVFPSEEGFDSLQSSLESASILESDKWITDIISFEEPSNLVKGVLDIHLQESRNLHLTKLCNKHKTTLSKMYPGIDKAVVDCFPGINRTAVIMRLSLDELVKIGYYSEYNTLNLRINDALSVMKRTRK